MNRADAAANNCAGFKPLQNGAADEITARSQLDDKGGYVTSREVTFMDSMQVYKGNKLTKKDKKNSEPIVE